MKKIWDNLLSLFFPKLCLLCKVPLVQGEEHVCLLCLCDLPHTGFHLQEENPVFHLFTGKTSVVRAAAWLYFEKGGKVQRIIHSFKYHDNKDLARQFGRQMAIALQSSPYYKETDVLLPVPLHPRRERKRGYNQSEWICRGMASVWNKPLCTDVLRRKTASATQTNRSLYDRWLNMQEIFVLHNEHSLEGKHILLIDDVVTSGSTLSACANLLLTIPNVKVSILSLAVA
ncbi:ComF family protein [Parabacteroides sp. PF5-5]|uniref:ComF family protein n=1 Tax=unclassified Parabacteroides TaxID=2649774 RepID=UPI00247390F6|nr:MULTISPECIES: ComF family protein [unclassified Parabacteroides]MDH6306082.1 ComF family protein [Parabacteroides sp. PH5-39]MDH6317020.1 ComF family protein [Parabacteroides sp. PF5-13]MDH6320773.1 ComF family protein [Parabacteroides sp. PH5-13]MDH6324525.1 ComF family protein [Parabacteroides sp. PH5-8]MDH6328205.1 ComF family protein [Parabacteroides sp. PH5-41]